MASQFSTIYAPLIAVWNVAGKPSGAAGTSITAGMTEAQQLAAIATWTINGPAQKALLTPSAILNAVVPADLAALTALPLQQLSTLLSGALVDASAGTTVRAGIQTIFAGKTTTLAQLGALVAPFDNGTVPWWKSVGLPQLPTHYDVVAAGLVGNPTMWTYAAKNKRRDAGSKNILVDILYTQVGADGATATGLTFTDTGYGGTNLTDAQVSAQALIRIVNVLLPGDDAFAAVTSG